MASEEQRNYERVIIIDPNSDVVPLERAFVVVEGKKLPVYDLSLKGVSFEHREGIDFKEQNEEALQLEISKQALEVKVRVVRQTEHIIACEILAMPVEARGLFNQFLENKLVGRHLAHISESFYRDERDFDSWYAGPRDFHVFIKHDDDRNVSRFKVESQDYKMTWTSTNQFSIESKTTEDWQLDLVKKEVMEILTHANDYENQLKNLMALIQG